MYLSPPPFPIAAQFVISPCAFSSIHFYRYIDKSSWNSHTRKMRILITGGTVFVSQCVAEYFSEKGNDVFVLNRGTRPQPENCYCIKADRHFLHGILRNTYFDAILDMTAYSADDIKDLLDSGVRFRDYIFLSSSAVYPETNARPFSENQSTGRNSFWGDYGLNKIAAEQMLLESVPNAYIVRPPYLYGAKNNVYREAFVFDCAELDRKFYVPRDGKMNLQFFNVLDLCRFLEVILQRHPSDRIFNVGNEDSISIRDWVSLCYGIIGKSCEFVEVQGNIPWRNYFCFYDYEYFLNVDRQKRLLGGLKDLKKGLQESYDWYIDHKARVGRRNYIEYIDSEFARRFSK